MPKPTFFNLPEAKRQRIFRAAVAEFAAHPYPQASINRIVARAGIAKGSLYQYFEDKRDLFRYCLQHIGEEKMAYLAPVLAQADALSFFELLRALYREGLRFAIEHPQYAAIGQQLLAAKDSPIVAEALIESEKAGEAFFATLLGKAIARGDVRADIPRALAASLLARLNAWVVEYYLQTHGTYDEGLLQIVDSLLDLLRRGLAAQSHPTPTSQGEPS